MTVKVCPECSTPIPRRDGPGRRASTAAIAAAGEPEQRAWRRAHPLGWRLMPDQPSPVELLRSAGIDA
jgi:hypothetical protein